MIKQKKSDDLTSKYEEVPRKAESDDKTTIKIKNNITPYVYPSLDKEIEIDNRVHFFESSLAS